MNIFKRNLIKTLKWSEKYTQTDMIYLTQSGFWILIGEVILFLVYFLTMLAFANFMPQKIYGTYQYILSMVALLSIFSLPGLNTSIVKSIAQNKEGNLLLFLKTKIKWGLIGSAGLLILSAWYFLHNQQLLGSALLIGGIFLPFYRTFTLFEGYWHGKKRFEIRTLYRVSVAILSAAIILPLIYFTNNILIILLALFLSSLLFEGFFFLQTLKKIKNKEENKQDLKFGKNLSVIGAIATVAGNIDKIILWKFLGPVQVAIYAFALLPIQKILSLNPISAIALPRISESGANKTLLKKFTMGFAITIPITALAIISASFIYETFFPEYLNSIIYFQALSLWILFAPFMLLNIALVAEARKKDLYIISISQSVIKITLFIALVPFFGIWGAILGLLGGEGTANILRLYFFIKLVNSKTT